MKTIKKLANVLFPVMVLVANGVLANDNIMVLRNYVKVTYGDQLNISDGQLRQLSWVMDNPVVTPETNHKKNAGTDKSIHREVPRALSRLYNLQRLRSGTEKDYLLFIAPQKAKSADILTRESFKELSKDIQRLDEHHYATLAAAAIISSVTLSPLAKERARPVLNNRIPEDSVRFLAATAPFADQIYPLAKAVNQQFKTGNHAFKVALLPDSHLRHMMYNEGSQAMYQAIKQGLRDDTLTQKELDFWYDHWMINIAGFRGHLAPKGSLYLTQNTYDAMSALKDILDQLKSKRDLNPMETYLGQRAEWLALNKLTNDSKEQLALASIAASLRLFSPTQGQELYKAFKAISSSDQKRWLKYNQRQLTNTHTPAPTYAPALFANALVTTGLADTLLKILPAFLDVIDEEQKMRSSGKLGKQVPVSFREISMHQQVQQVLSRSFKGKIHIDPVTGVVSLKP